MNQTIVFLIASIKLPPSHNNPTLSPTMQIPPNVDPTQLEHLIEQMMVSLMNDFEQLNTSKDSNDMVDG